MIDERVVIGELDERPRPDFLDRPDVADHLRHSNSEVGEDLLLTPGLRESMLRVLAPCRYGRLVTPEGDGHVSVLVVYAAKSLDGQEAVDRFELRAQAAGKIEVIPIPPGLHFHFEDDRQHRDNDR